MNQCEKCNPNPVVCEYCEYFKSKNNKTDKDTHSEKVIFFNNAQYDNKSKKICPICKKIYTGYPATSRKDNKTLICSECGVKEVQEPFEELLNEYEIGIFE